MSRGPDALIAKLHAAATGREEPPASAAMVASAEQALGCGLPPLLRRIYLEVANGGRLLRDGCDLLGVPGSRANRDDILSESVKLSEGLEWWDRHVVIHESGCCSWSCIDCTDADYTVHSWNGDHFDETTDREDPSPLLWSVEADTFEDWLDGMIDRTPRQ